MRYRRNTHLGQKPRTDHTGILIILAALVVGVVWGTYDDFGDKTVQVGDQMLKMKQLYHNGNYVVGADSHKIKIAVNPNAKDVTYGEVVRFVLADETDTIEYTDTFQCGDYAELVQHNAEAQNIKCGYLFVDFTDGGDGHLVNVFNTTDRGLVYIDCTENDAEVKSIEPGTQYWPGYISPVEDDELVPMGTIKSTQVIFG